MHFTHLRQAGFNVTEFVETKAIPETEAYDKNYYDRFSHFPQFCVFVASKPSGS
jgi:hypothetical protein